MPQAGWLIIAPWHSYLLIVVALLTLRVRAKLRGLQVSQLNVLDELVDTAHLLLDTIWEIPGASVWHLRLVIALGILWAFALGALNGTDLTCFSHWLTCIRYLSKQVFFFYKASCRKCVYRILWGLTLLNRVNWEWQAAWVWDSGAEWGWDQYQGGAAYTHAHGYRALATAQTAVSPGNSHCSIR